MVGRKEVVSQENLRCPLEGWMAAVRNQLHQSKNLHTINVGKSVEKRETSCTVGGNVNWYSHYGEQYGSSLKD